MTTDVNSAFIGGLLIGGAIGMVIGMVWYWLVTVFNSPENR